MQAADGKVCSQTCVEDCPTGWNCAEKKGVGGDVTYLCLPRFVNLCDPCNDNTACNDPGKSGNTCVSFGAAGSFCGAKCDEITPECPGGYSCQAVVDGKTGQASHQCVREAGLCDCSVRAVELALETTCTNQNLYGACKGSRFCTANGLGACAAAIPAAELCNGIDDDCNGKTDDFDASAPCTKTNEFGGCPGKILACDNGQTVCDAPDAKPELCNGLDDNCDGKTDEGICDDGNDCTIDKCDSAGGCIHKGTSGIQCSDDGDPCTNDICNDDGQCIHKGVAGVVCDDGSICTQTDKCVAGSCIGGNALACDDGDACTTDACDPFTGCTHVAASDAVCTDDGNLCTQDICQGGKCVHPPVAPGAACADDGKLCTADVCENGGCVHIGKDGGKCDDDGSECTKDICNNGVCTHIPGAAACEDGNPCTLNDICKSGVCSGGTTNPCDDGKPCSQDSCDPKAGCIHNSQAMDYKFCQAPSANCPVGVCSGGGCFSKANEICQTKVKVNLCEKVDAIGTCTAAGQCVAQKLTKPDTCPDKMNCKTVCINCYSVPFCMDFIFLPGP